MIKKLYILISRLFFSICYDKKYLKGRWFEESLDGYKWCWKNIIHQKLFRINSKVPFPVSQNIVIGNYKNLVFDINDLNNFQHFGCYFQCYRGKIVIGKGTYIAPNVGIITENHNVKNLNKHDEAKDVLIGENCWIGMNSVILPGVELGNGTIIGAGSIVTKSFTEGNCVVVGNPAKVIKRLGDNIENKK